MLYRLINTGFDGDCNIYFCRKFVCLCIIRINSISFFERKNENNFSRGFALFFFCRNQHKEGFFFSLMILTEFLEKNLYDI